MLWQALERFLRSKSQLGKLSGSEEEFAAKTIVNVRIFLYPLLA